MAAVKLVNFTTVNYKRHSISKLVLKLLLERKYAPLVLVTLKNYVGNRQFDPFLANMIEPDGYTSIQLGDILKAVATNGSVICESRLSFLLDQDKSGKPVDTIFKNENTRTLAWKTFSALNNLTAFQKILKYERTAPNPIITKIKLPGRRYPTQKSATVILFWIVLKK